MTISQRARHSSSSNVMRKVVAASVGTAASVALIGMAGPASASTVRTASANGGRAVVSRHHGHGPGSSGRHGHDPRWGHRGVRIGVVASLGTGSFTITEGSKTETVDVSTATVYEDNGVASPSFADVTVGARVAVAGTVPSPGTVDATKIRVLPTASDATESSTSRSHVDGTVSTIGAGSFAISEGSATVTVDVSATTVYQDEGVTAPSLADVTVGEHVSAAGVLSSPGVLSATSVSICQARTGDSSGSAS